MQSSHDLRRAPCFILVLVLAFAGCASPTPPLSAEQIAAVLAAPDRSEADKANDARHKARELKAAGFTLVAEGQFLRNPGDPRDQSVFKPAQPNDEFVLKFRKP